MNNLQKIASASVFKVMLTREAPEESQEIMLEEGLPDGYMDNMVERFFPFIGPASPNPGDKTSYSAKRGRSMLGSVSIKNTPSGRHEIGVTIAPSHQGKGLSRVLVDLLMGKHPHDYYDWRCHQDNAKSLKLLQSLGGGLLNIERKPGHVMLKGLISGQGFINDQMKQRLIEAIERLS